MPPTGPVLSPADVLEILRQRRDLKIPRWKVAENFGVSKRTITRICQGETWNEVVNLSPYKPKTQVAQLKPLRRGFDKDYNEVVNLKRKFGFAFERPIYWGSYDSYDGRRDVVTDGIIMWHSLSGLFDEIRRIAGLNDISGAEARELDTFEISQIMGAPIGEPLIFDHDDLSGIIRYRTQAGRFVLLAEKFVTLAHSTNCVIYEVETDPNRVFLVSWAGKQIWDPTDGIQACLATVTETA